MRIVKRLGIVVLWLVTSVVSAAPKPAPKPTPAPAPPPQPVSPAAAVAKAMAAAYQYATNRQFLAAIDVYDSVIQRSRNTPEAQEALFRKGLCLRAQKRLKDLNKETTKDLYKEAIGCWESVLGFLGPSPWKADAMLELAGTDAFDLNKPDLALGRYQRLLQDYPRSERFAEARLQVAIIETQRGNFPAARALWEKFLADFPDSPDRPQADLWLAKCAKALRLSSSGKALRPSEILLAEADAAYKRQDYRAAQPLYKQVIATARVYPEYDKAICRSARCLTNLGDIDAALATLEELLHWKPASERASEALLLLGNVQMEILDQTLDALNKYEKLLKDFPDSALADRAQFQSALAQMRLGRFDEAKEMFQKLRAARDAATDSAPSPLELDRLIMACADKEFYVSDAARAADSVERWKSLGQMLFAARKYYEAERAFMHVATAHVPPEEAAACLFLAGRSFQQVGRWDKALECYRPVFDKYKESQWADAALLRAAVILIGPYRQAKEGALLLEKIVQFHPTSSVADLALLDLGTLAFWDKDWLAAQRRYNQLLERYPASLYAGWVKGTQLPIIQAALAPRKADRAAGAAPVLPPVLLIPKEKMKSVTAAQGNGLVKLRVFPSEPGKAVKDCNLIPWDSQHDTTLWQLSIDEKIVRGCDIQLAVCPRLLLQISGALQPVAASAAYVPTHRLLSINVPHLEPEIDEAEVDESGDR